MFIIDALAGNDRVIVGPTVQKTVWIDAGDGDDRVEIRSGNAILTDQTEQVIRNDQFGNASILNRSSDGTLAPISGNTSFTGLTLDNPDDEDWYRVEFGDTTAGQLFLTSLSANDGMLLRLYDISGQTRPGG